MPMLLEKQKIQDYHSGFYTSETALIYTNRGKRRIKLLYREDI